MGAPGFFRFCLAAFHSAALPECGDMYIYTHTHSIVTATVYKVTVGIQCISQVNYVIAFSFFEEIPLEDHFLLKVQKMNLFTMYIT